MGLLNNDLVQVRFKGLCFNQQVMMVRNYLISGDFPAVNSVATDLGLIIGAVAAAGINDIQTPYLACLPPQYQLFNIEAQRFKPTRSAYVTNAIIGAVGTNAGAATTVNDSAAITCRTANAGRSHTGTVHVGPMPDAAAAAGMIVAAMLANLSALGNKLIAAFVPPTSGSLVIPVLWNRKTNTTDIINNFILGATSRVQRRRTVGIGS